MQSRPQWPHTVDDIYRSLDGVWGLVAAVSTDGNLVRLEKSLKEPFIYTLLEFDGEDEKRPTRSRQFDTGEKDSAIKAFASLLGFSDN